MNYLETPEELLQKHTRSNYKKDVTDVIETVMHTYQYVKLLENGSLEDSNLNVPVTFMYKNGFAVPTRTSIPTSDYDNTNAKDLISDFLRKNNCDYSIHLRICYGFYYTDESFEDKDFYEKYSQYKAIIKLIEDNKIDDTQTLDDLLLDYKGVSATCIDRQGIKYQVLLSLDKLEQFEIFIERFIGSKDRVNLNDVFEQEFISFTLNNQREFESIDKSEFQCIDPEEFAVNVKPF